MERAQPRFRIQTQILLTPKTLVNYRYYWVYSSGPLGFDYEKTASPLDKAGLRFAKDVAKNDPEHHLSRPHPKCWY